MMTDISIWVKILIIMESYEPFMTQEVVFDEGGFGFDSVMWGELCFIFLKRKGLNKVSWSPNSR